MQAMPLRVSTEGLLSKTAMASPWRLASAEVAKRPQRRISAAAAIARDVRPGLAAEGGERLVEMGDDAAPAAALQKINRGLDLGAHAPGREMARGVELLHLGERHAVEPALL